MAILQSCCFWKNVRKGSFASAFYTLIYFGFCCFVMLIYVHDEQDFLNGERGQPVGESILARGDITPAIVIFNMLFLGCSFFLVISSILVVIGLRNDKREYLLPWIVFMLCDLLIELSHLVYLTITKIVKFDPVVGFIFTIDLFIMCLNSYCLLCVISQYQNYRQGQGCNHRSGSNAQMRTEVVFQVPQNHMISGASARLKHTKLQHAPLGPFVTLNRPSNISTIPEEDEQTHRQHLSKDVSSFRDENKTNISFLANGMQNEVNIPIVVLESNSNQ